MIAHSPEELELFSEIDKERNEENEKYWESLGFSGKYEPLITYDELPSYLKQNIEDLMKEEELPLTRRVKMPTDVLTDDSISESEFSRLCEDGIDSSAFSKEIEKV
jgi:hypothetical protein